MEIVNDIVLWCTERVHPFATLILQTREGPRASWHAFKVSVDKKTVSAYVQESQVSYGAQAERGTH